MHLGLLSHRWTQLSNFFVRQLQYQHEQLARNLFRSLPEFAPYLISADPKALAAGEQSRKCIRGRGTGFHG